MNRVAVTRFWIWLTGYTHNLFNWHYLWRKPRVGESCHDVVKDDVDKEPVCKDEVHHHPEELRLVPDVWQHTDVEYCDYHCSQHHY